MRRLYFEGKKPSALALWRWLVIGAAAGFNLLLSVVPSSKQLKSLYTQRTEGQRHQREELFMWQEQQQSSALEVETAGVSST